MKASHLFSAIALAATLSAPVHAQVPVPSPPSVDARAYVVVDFNSGAELAGSNVDQGMEPASITKLMSAYVAFTELRAGRLALDDQALISERAWRMPGSRMFVDVNTRVRIEDLLRGIIIQSGNDATVALAEHIAGTEEAFAEMMNAHARRLGMENTHFTNSTGMPDAEMYTTARDIAQLTVAMIQDFPDFYELYSEREFTWNNIRQTNRNMLLWRDPSVDGVKTGHTESAGYCLVTSALRNDQRLVSVVFGTQSERARADISLALLNYGFRFFETHRLYAAGTELAEARVWKGSGEAVPVGLKEDLWVTIPRGSYRNLTASMDLQSQLIAPVDTEQEVGRVRVTLNDEALAERTLHTLAPVPEGSIWRRAVDTIILWFE